MSIFGSSRHGQNFQAYRLQAAHIAHKLVHRDISVLTGGGPGIMEAANCGAHATPAHNYRTMKISIRGLPEPEELNRCAGEIVEVDDFFTRKWLLFDHSIGFVVFPGGLGTMDELSDLVNLIACGKLKPRIIVLMGVEHWQAYTDFIKDGIAQGYINEATVPEMVITDDVDEAIGVLQKHCDTCATPTPAA